MNFYFFFYLEKRFINNNYKNSSSIFQDTFLSAQRNAVPVTTVNYDL